MDFYNIHSESDLFTITSNNSIQTLHNINKYYKSVHEFAEIFMINTKKSIEIFFQEQINIDTKTSLSKNLMEFYTYYEDFTIKSRNLLNKLYKDIIEPVDLFKSNLTSIFEECQDEMKIIASSVIEAKRNLEKTKLKYYESCKNVCDQEKIACKGISGKLMSNTNQFEKTHDLLLKYKGQKESMQMIYNYEINKANKTLDENERYYVNLLIKIKSNEESKIFFIKCHMEKFVKLCHDLNILFQEFYKKINTSVLSIKIEEDIKIFYEKFKSINNYKENLRFKKEEFISYEIYLKQQEIEQLRFEGKNNDINSAENQLPSTKNSDNDYTNNSISTKNENQKPNEKKNFLEDFEFVNINDNFSEQYLNKISENFLLQIFSDEEIELELIGKIMEALENNTSFMKTLVDMILFEKKNAYLQFFNYLNMQHLANIFYNIAIKIDSPLNKSYELNFALIFLGERSFFLDEKTQNKFYLCSILSKNRLFKRKTFWMDLIKLKLSKRIEEHMKKISKLKTERQVSTISENISNTIAEEFKGIELNNKNNNTNNRNDESEISNKNNENSSVKENKTNIINIESNQDDNSKNKQNIENLDVNAPVENNIFSNLSNKLINFFNSSQTSSLRSMVKNSGKKNIRGADHNRSIFSISGINLNGDSVNLETKPETINFEKIFIDYPKLIYVYSNLDNKKKALLEKVICKEISSIIKEFIPHFANFNYDISEAIDLLVDLSTKFKLEKEKINYYVTYLNSNFYTIKNKFANLTSKGYQIARGSVKKNKIKDFKVDSIIFSLNYLDNISKFSLLSLNKLFFSKYQKKIYYKILKNAEKDGTLTNKIRLEIWKQMLNIKEVKKQYNYKSLLEEIDVVLNSNIDENFSNIIKIIELDVDRTFFEKNILESRKAISNILKGVAYFVPKISYCQGMNYIASFLYQIGESEEEAFDLMYGFFLNTEFPQIFVDELSKLNRYFYVFERLLFLYLPELNQCFKNNSITVNYFCSSWFITLFTNSLHYSADYQCPKIVLNIWDDFLMNGWIAILRGGLALLKKFELFLMDQKYEELLQYLINDLIKSEFFSNENFEYFINIKKNIKIKSSLISNIESEIIQENKTDLKKKDSLNSIDIFHNVENIR